jgi:hypothetical protein
MGKVYLLKAGEVYKIGVTTNGVEVRVKQLQTGCPHKITVITEGTLVRFTEEERNLHARYSDYNTSGEWYAISEREAYKLMEYINALDSLTNMEVSLRILRQELNNQFYDIQKSVESLGYISWVSDDKEKEIKTLSSRYKEGKDSVEFLRTHIQDIFYNSPILDEVEIPLKIEQDFKN